MADALEEAVLSGRLFNNGLAINERANGDDEDGFDDNEKSAGDGQSEKASDDDDVDASNAQSQRTGPRTGAKGVKEDARIHEEKQSLSSLTDEKAKSDYLKSKALVMSQSESDTDDSERQARESYRRTRIRQLKMASTGGVRVFGHLRKVDANTYITAIDDEEEDVFVVILIKDNSIEACVDLEYSFASLAQVYTSTKFLSGEATTLEFGLDAHGVPDPDILPTVLVYRAGSLHSSLIRPDLEKSPVEQTLADDGVLQLVERAVDENGDLDE
ncbi:hypothetical protein E3P89_03952 [Wallemia ichthyophaga]|uniref:Phosducin domain-containing protein n=1 Tax=Wallemia ichthyophaga TaxID=245174 RepID=A0A4T0I143_WALIC|nr:hypothetical protein E3P93_03968 [Wallemia ichthyophaga]TIB07675.1 hypothetical protein E3P90_03965 [Wallemia ichthyophaga]TIB19448.1 hypothetical protein E3P89_03952 [Wallemia ichthyophaga]TIB20311.1 hypothetical protein E3P88_03971 [Wallemia ichthyophaga]TIB30880.1 hypothetical protein E3P84_03173 [Wallemia ichthyophaga]